MFDKHIFIRTAEDHSVQAANILAMSNKAHDETLKSISEKEIKSKDRVDISLEEYERLKNQLTILRNENFSLKTTLTGIGIPLEVLTDIIPNSIEVQRCEDCIGFETSYRVTFSVRDIQRRLL